METHFSQSPCLVTQPSFSSKNFLSLSIMSQDTPMWNFALECVSEGVIIASCDERSRSSIKIGYANRHASRILSCVQEEILDSQIFQAEKFRESFMLSIKSQQVRSCGRNY